jgi:hypothetical protein
MIFRIERLERRARKLHEVIRNGVIYDDRIKDIGSWVLKGDITCSGASAAQLGG